MPAVTGLDIGHRTVRACVLERVGSTLRVKGFGEVARLDEAGEAKPLPAVIAELDAKVGFAGEVVCADGDITALVRFVSTLPLPPDRLARLLRLELSQHADASGDLAADAMVVPIPSDELMHLCVLAQPAQVYSALVDLREAGVRSPRVHFGPAAAYNATLPLPPVHDSALALLVDIGSDTTGVTLFGEDRLLACRQVPVGGQAFTDALVAAGRDAAAAERSKRDPPSAAPQSAEVPVDDDFGKMLDSGLEVDAGPAKPAAEAKPGIELESGDAPASAASAAGDGKPASAPPIRDHEEFVIEDAGQLSDRLPAAAPSKPAPAERGLPPGARSSPPPARADELQRDLAKPADALYGQIVSSLTWFKAQLKLRSIELKLVCLAGGGAGLPGLEAYLQRRLNVPVQRFDPFAGVEGGAKPERPYEYAVAAGLAFTDKTFRLRHAARFDLRPDTLVRKELWRARLIWPFVAAACVILGTVFAMLELHARYEAQRASIAVYEAYVRDYDGQKKRLDDLDAQKDALTDDLRAIASRIYAGRDLLYAIRALKERTDQSPQLWVTKLVTKAIGEDASLTQEEIERGGISDETKDSSATAIERGAIVVSGLVKFDNKLNMETFRQFIRDWKEFILNWTPDNQTHLFKRAQEFSFDMRTNGSAGGKNGGDQPRGEVPWTWAFYFAPTDLSQVVSTREMAPQPPAGPAEKK